jgi:hypothetical protein
MRKSIYKSLAGGLYLRQFMYNIFMDECTSDEAGREAAE